MKTLSKVLLVCALGLFMVGCTSKPINTVNEQVSINSSKAMETSILNALNTKGWRVDSTQPGKINASISVRDRHQAKIEIPYTANTFQIKYVDSSGLDYKDGNIHNNYNRWVNNLRVAIIDDLYKSKASR